MKTTHFTITRSRWSGVKPNHNSRLLGPDKKQCCLGFYCSAAGIPKQTISQWASISGSMGDNRNPISIPDDMKWLELGDPYGEISVESRLIKLNDTRTIPLPEKEKKIAAIFAANGITVTFED